MLREILKRNKSGECCGKESYCTADPLVIETCLQSGLRTGESVLIEATANQVNQFGGYTGMKPEDFRDMVYEKAALVGLPREQIILGGDHLGPLTWCSLPENEAMAFAEELVRCFVRAGFEKIHLDTSMRLGSDSPDETLPVRTVAERGAALFAACQDEYAKLLGERPGARPPVYIIGSEVPIPGGATVEESSITVTSPDALRGTVETYREVFARHGLDSAFENIVGIVVQPGVEFGDDGFFRYDPEKAKALMAAARSVPGLVLEGHSTDYQPREALREMVADGVAILKVGPALTFALREGLFALSDIERELIPPEERADFPAVLERLMLENDSNWRRHYHGTPEELRLKRRYSLSDRCRYYLSAPEARSAVEKLFANIDGVSVPLGLVRQYLPMQYGLISAASGRIKARDIVKEFVFQTISDYNYAVAPK